MTSFEIARLDFERAAVRQWSRLDPRFGNWPVVYVLDNAGTEGSPGRAGASLDVYVGETLSAANRMAQHLESPEKDSLTTIRVIVDDTFNKSACLDLESYLIRWFAGDGAYRVLNRNDGIVDSEYYQRDSYRETFRDVFDRLKDQGVFTRTIPEIENSDLFKLSPFKALTQDQAAAVEDIVEGLFEDLETGQRSTIVIKGGPGTGKTVVAIYLLKLLADIGNTASVEHQDNDSRFSEFFAEGYRSLLTGLRIGLVVPQQSLRQSIKKVFRKTPGLSPTQVLSPFEVGAAALEFDLLIVDETHRLNQRANQASAAQNTKFREINESLFGADDPTKTQLDWIRAKSKHQVFLVDAAQSVRPADLPAEALAELERDARSSHRHYSLVSQMRVRADADYVGYVRGILSNGDPEAPPSPRHFGDYEFRIFDDVGKMQDEIERRDAEFGLARLVAGYAWKWQTKDDPSVFDIELDGRQLRWNKTQTDWIASAGSLAEVGSIHTVQGYDLNYAGVIIGPDLRYDPAAGRIYVDRASYADGKGKENNRTLGKIYTDDDLLRFITNIYAVLLTRGIRGTFVYVCDPALRAHLKAFVPD
jgi:DUF2075 family protein